MNTIPFLDIALQDKKIHGEIKKIFEDVSRNAQFIKGPLLEGFERKFAAFVGTKYCIGVASGTDALHLSLVALGIKKGDEVILPANTFAATAYAVIYCGAKPVLVDVDEHTFNLDTTLLKRAITKKTKAIIPVHLYGTPAEMKKINQIAKVNHLYVLEDACQSHGAKYLTRKTGNLGDIAAFSFYPGKNLGAYGDGGAVTTNSFSLATKVRKLREYGSLTKYEYEIVGFNSRLDSLQAAILTLKLKYLDTWNKKRRKVAAYYTKKIPLQVPEVKVPNVKAFQNSVYHLYVIRTSRRNELMQYLDKQGIKTGIHYPIPLHLQESLKYLGYKKGSFPITETLSNEILSIPFYPDITPEQQDYVVKNIQEFFRKK